MKLPFFEAIWNTGAEIYQVGGGVRDELLGVSSKDVDLLVCGLSLEELKSILNKSGNVALVGKSFGVLKWNDPTSNQIVDVALPRKELSTGEHHRDFDINFDPNIPVEQDLERRDFTINAIAKNLKDGSFIDPFGGMIDLEKKSLRQVFTSSFPEDPLRLVRAIQFAARFCLTIENKTWAAMQEHAALIKTVSAERIVEEIRKLFLSEKPSLGFDLMEKCGLLSIIFPEIKNLIGVKQAKLPGDDVYGHTMRVLNAARVDEELEEPGDLEILFAALFHDVGKPATRQYDCEKDKVVFYGHQVVSAKLWRRWAKKMKVSILGVDSNRVNTLIFNHMFETKSFFADKAIRRFIQKIGKDLIFRLLDLRLADNRGGKHPNSINGVLKMRKRVREILAQKPPFGTGDLAIDGHTLIEIGFQPGPNMGKVLKELVETVLDDPTLNREDTLIEIVQKKIKKTPEILNGHEMGK